jgi:hypothetical protein
MVHALALINYEKHCRVERNETSPRWTWIADHVAEMLPCGQHANDSRRIHAIDCHKEI